MNVAPGVPRHNARLAQLWDLRLIRTQLAAMKLDWNLPSYPPAAG